MKPKTRTRLSFSLLGLLVGLFVFGTWQVNTEKRLKGAPWLLRQAHLWNETFWRSLEDRSELSILVKPPALGTKPRSNGMVGLKTPVSVKSFRVEIRSGERSLSLPMSAFYLLPRRDYATEFRCIEGWSEEMAFAGVRFSEFISHYHLGKKADGRYYSYVGLETPDGKYYVSLDMEAMLHDQTLLAYEMNGAPLRLENGFPLRLVVPIKYGIKSLKRVGKIFFSDTRPRDYWAQRGYDWYSGL
jgi:DMSO/TMAO reductase YedYZ molybdopterin-dependent catalytic subunit